MKPQDAASRLSYCPATGHLHWRPTSTNDAWNKRYAGKRAGGVKSHPNGGAYRYIKLYGKQHLEHRIAWMIMTGEDAPESIDHRNRDGLDNRWTNLRDGTATNSVNRGRQSNNRSGVTGASFHKRSSKWEAYVRRNGVKHHLGLFSSADQAGEAARALRNEMGFDKTHGA